MPQKKKKYVVRIITDNENFMDATFFGNGGFIECLRYAGIIRIHRDNEEGKCFDLLPPEHIVKAGTSKSWAHNNAGKIASFGINAVKAPEWLDEVPKV